MALARKSAKIPESLYDSLRKASGTTARNLHDRDVREPARLLRARDAMSATQAITAARPTAPVADLQFVYMTGLAYGSSLLRFRCCARWAWRERGRHREGAGNARDDQHLDCLGCLEANELIISGLKRLTRWQAGTGR